ncbi:MAG: crotonase/enoyl-CoA hydratase family protein [Ilumatobacteraceae bacterium]
MSDRVIISIADGVADVRFNRPDKRNALDREQFAAIAEAGESLKSADGVRVVVLSGVGESFCAGLDFSMFSGMAESGPRATVRVADDHEQRGDPGQMVDGRITHLGQQVCWVWQELHVPVIAAVHGHALGGGLQIALGADIRIAHPATKWSVREVHWGLVPDMTGTFTLSRLVRSDVARELTYTARMLDGREAFELGLVTRLSETPYDDAMALAREIAGRSPGAVRGAKALFNRMYADGAADQFAEERRVIAGQIGSPDQVEAIMSNLEHRAPAFAD